MARGRNRPDAPGLSPQGRDQRARSVDFDAPLKPALGPPDAALPAAPGARAEGPRRCRVRPRHPRGSKSARCRVDEPRSSGGDARHGGPEHPRPGALRGDHEPLEYGGRTAGEMGPVPESEPRRCGSSTRTAGFGSSARQSERDPRSPRRARTVSTRPPDAEFLIRAWISRNEECRMRRPERSRGILHTGETPSSGRHECPNRRRTRCHGSTRDPQSSTLDLRPFPQAGTPERSGRP